MLTYTEFLTEAFLAEAFSPEKKISGLPFNATIINAKKAGTFKNVKCQVGSPKGHVSGVKNRVTFDNFSLDIMKDSIWERLEGLTKADVVIYPELIKETKTSDVDVFARMSREKPYHIQGWSRESESCLFEIIFK